MKHLKIRFLCLAIGLCAINLVSAAEPGGYEARPLAEAPVTYEGQYLTAVDFPVGALGGGVIRMNGKGERIWWQIFHNHEERRNTGFVPNSFFAIRAKQGEDTVVRALQTSGIGPFAPMESLSFQTQYPFGWYHFEDAALPVKVTLEAFNPLIPMDLKNSAIPTGIFRFKLANPGSEAVEVDLLGTQQNAVGFSGYGAIGGPNQRQWAGYGENRNAVVSRAGTTGVALTGPEGSMHFSVHADDASASAAWEDLDSLHADFSSDGKLDGAPRAESPAANVTVDAALATSVRLAPGEKKSVTFVLSWHIPGGTFGRKKTHAPDRNWYFPNAGSQYENWWADAAEVDAYVTKHFDNLDAKTRLYHDSVYASNLPRFVLDRITSNISVLKSPTTFWTKDGYVGIWESTSNKQQWYGNVKHVIHYAQGHARLYPELGRILRKIDLDTQTDAGFLIDRDGGVLDALDGHFGTILGVYREHLLSTDDAFLKSAWPRTKKAIDHAIDRHDPDRDGMLMGSYHNTLDCNSSGTSPWIGSLYIASLKAGEQMAAIMGENEKAAGYRQLWKTAIENQNQQLWSEERGHYIEKPQGLPGTLVMNDAVSLDMFLGQWWANQLGLGQIYPVDRTQSGLAKIYEINRITDNGSNYKANFRDFLGTGDTGWQMFVHYGKVPRNSIRYYSEVMSGFEYAAAGTMLQYGMIDQGLEMVEKISQRYDGRLRAKGEVHMANNSTVYGTGSPIGEDECGDYYVRPLSSWSLLLALQGFSYNGPEKAIGFRPVWKPDDHRSFFTAAAGWGLFRQNREASKRTSAIELKFGTLEIKTLVLTAPNGHQGDDLIVSLDGKPLAVEAIQREDGELEITLKQSAALKAGSSFKVEIPHKKREETTNQQK